MRRITASGGFIGSTREERSIPIGRQNPARSNRDYCDTRGFLARVAGIRRPRSRRSSLASLTRARES